MRLSVSHLQTLLDKLEGDVRATNTFVDLMNARYFDLVERKQVLACVEEFYQEKTFVVDHSVSLSFGASDK